MLVCHGCHRHVRLTETGCPFCGTTVCTTQAPGPLRLGAMALVVGLGLLGCSDDGSVPNDSMTSATMESGSSTGPGTSMTTDDPESGGADYGGPDDWGEETSGDGDGDPPGDGDGDGDPAGDGDGDPPGDGDGDPAGDGDGDTTTGDGDGDMTSGDGDGDGTTTGDGDGDSGGADYGGAPPPDPNDPWQ